MLLSIVRECVTVKPMKAQQRQCMPCTACCEGWLYAEVEEFVLTPGHPCPHSSKQGCGIYPERPEVPCRTFVCSWRVDHSTLPDWMRPDECGAIVLLSLPWQGELVISAVPVGENIPAHTLDWLMAYARKHQRPMIYYQRVVENGEFAGVRRLGYGPPAFREKVARLGLQSAHADAAMDSRAEASQGA